MTVFVCEKLHVELVTLPTNEQVKLAPAAIGEDGTAQFVVTTCSQTPGVADPVQDVLAACCVVMSPN